MSLNEFAQEVETIRQHMVNLHHHMRTLSPEQHTLVSGSVEGLLAYAEQLQRQLGQAESDGHATERPATETPTATGSFSQPQDAGNLVARSTGLDVMSRHREAILSRERAVRGRVNDVRQRLALLAEASHLLLDAVDVDLMLARVARLVADMLADWCTIDLIESGEQLRQVALAHRNPALEESLYALRQHYPLDPTRPHPVFKVIQTGHIELMPEISASVLEPLTYDAGHIHLLQRLGMRAAMMLPLKRHGQMFGVISLVWAQANSYTPEDIALAKDLASRIAAALDTAWRYREAQVAVRQRDRFVSIVSHELKTPLTTLLGFARLLQQWSNQPNADPERNQRALERITEQVYRLNDLINTLLDLSHIRTSQFHIEKTLVDVGVLVQDLIEGLRPALQQHTVTVNGTCEPLLVEGDSTRLRQVLQNLIDNALKYSPDGGNVAITVERKAARVCVQVTDTGIGIPSEAMPHLFKSFYRAANGEARGIEGMGIGLYLVNEIIIFHGGHIEVESTEGNGSTFTVYLPLAEQAVIQAGERLKERCVGV